MRRLACLPLVALLGLTACGGGNSTTTKTTGAGSTYAIVPDSEVTAGLGTIKSLAAATPIDVKAIYAQWFTFEGTARARDKTRYIDLEDALANVKTKKDAQSVAALDKTIDAYITAHPGDGSEPPLTTAALSVTHTVAVRLDDYEFTLPSRIEAGVTRFELTNRSKHQVKHEFVVFRTALGSRSLPVDAKGKIDEKGAGVEHITELGDLAPGATGELVADLPAGSYVFACNVDDHYKRGMTIAIKVV